MSWLIVKLGGHPYLSTPPRASGSGSSRPRLRSELWSTRAL